MAAQHTQPAPPDRADPESVDSKAQFLRYLPSFVRLLEMAGDDRRRLALLATDLRRSARMYGIHPVASAASDLERALNTAFGANSLNETTRMADELSKLIERCREAAARGR